MLLGLMLAVHKELFVKPFADIVRNDTCCDGQRERWNRRQSASLYGDNVFEKDGIRRDRTGDGEKTRCLCGKRGVFNRDGPAMGPQIIRQLERRASR